MADALSILRAPSFGAFEQRLSAAIAQNPRLAAVRDNVAKPVLLLDAMTNDVLAALGDGALEADRLRMMLYLAWPYGSLVAEADALLARDTSDAYYEPGVIDHGALVMLAIATIHTAPSQAAAPLGLRAIHGLALASSAAEVIGRLDPKLPDASAMGAVLQTLYLLDAVSADTRSSILQLFAIDPVERARWRCLSRLLDPERSPFIRRELGSYGVWPGGFSHPIVEVSPNRAAPGDVITLVFDGRELGQGDHVVFAAPDRPPIDAEFFNQRRDDDLGPRLIDVRVPEGVSPGWVGVSNDDLIEQSNLHRGELQLSLPAALAGHTCLRESSLPADRIPMLGALAVPPRTGLNRFHGGAPAPAPAGRVRVVLIRPAIVLDDALIPPVPSEAARRLIEASLRARNIDAPIYEPPWITDDLAAIPWEPESDADPGLLDLFERLAAAALATPKLEDAMWLMVVPTGGVITIRKDRGAAQTVGVSRTAEAARAVAVADLRGLPRLLAAFDSLEPLPEASRYLRIVAKSDGDAITLTHVEEETRQRGFGAPEETGYVAAALDRAGRALGSTPIKGYSRDAPRLLGALVPISPRVAAVELRLNGEVVANVARPEGSVAVTKATWNPDRDTMTWDYKQSHGIRARASIALRSEGIDTPAFELGACDGEPTIPLHRFAGAEGLVVLATDGWNGASKDIAETAFERSETIVLRQIGERRYWADAPEGWSVRWSLNGRALAATGERLMTLSPRDEGTLRIEASKGDVTLADARRVEKIR